MKKQVAIGVGATIILVVITATLLSAPKVSDYSAPSPSSTPTPTAVQTVSTNAQAVPGEYINYSSDAIAKSSGTKVLFFHAPWCPKCRELDTSIKAGSIPQNVTIIKVDYDSNQSLRQKYGVTIQTTLVRVDDDGNLVKKYVAYDSPTLDAVIKNAL